MTVIDTPLVLAPMAGGPSTVDLAAAVGSAGGFPFLAGAYLTAERLAADIGELRDRLGDAAFGVNLFAPSPDEPTMAAEVEAYAASLRPWAELAGVELGEPRWADDDFDAKVEVLVRDRVPVASFSFAWPSAEVVDLLHAGGAEVWVTVNDAGEVAWARELGVTGLIAQGWEAGGHRGGPVDTGEVQLGTRELLESVLAVTDLPVVAAGGVMDAAGLRALRDAGAHAVSCGTAFLCAHEAGTSAVHRQALATRRRTVVTRAFTGRSARALATSWTDLAGPLAPAAYPHVHFLTAPLRGWARTHGEMELVALWAGEGHTACRSLPAAEIAALLLP